MPNAGFLIGHSALRRAVLHDDAIERPATAEEIDRMKALLATGLAAGGLGFSSTWSTTHNDHNGEPVPSRHASPGGAGRSGLGGRGLPGHHARVHPRRRTLRRGRVRPDGRDEPEANRPLNWNLLQVYAKTSDYVDHQLAGGDYAAEHGGRVLALTLPDSFRPGSTSAAGSSSTSSRGGTSSWPCRPRTSWPCWPTRPAGRR